MINHAGQFPAVTLSFNLAPGASLGDAVAAIEEAQQEIGMPASIQTRFQGAAEAFRASLDSTLLLILAAIVTMYIVLGVLYESYIHPITILSTLPSAGVGALLALLVIGQRPEPDRHHRHHPADRHRQEERDHDDRLRARRRAQRGHVAARRHLSGGAAALPADSDDDAGGAVRRAAADVRRRARAPRLRQPLGLVMVGGLLVSQVLTLFTTPVIYLFFDRLGALARRQRRPLVVERA